MDRIAGLFGGGESAKPVHAEEAGVPPPQAGTSGTHPRPQVVPEVKPEEPAKDTTAEAQPKKRGFWARVFGRDGKKPDQKDQKDKKKDR